MLDTCRMDNWLAPFIRHSEVGSQERLAELIGLSRATINRLANDHSKLKRERAEQMAPHLGVTVEDLMLNRLPWEAATNPRPDAPEVSKSAPPRTVAIRATVEAGAWREIDQFDQSGGEWVQIPPDDRFPDATQDVYDVLGDSMNRLEPQPIMPGSRIVALRYDEVSSRSPLRDGLVVVVQRSRDGGHTRELSVKLVAWFDDRIEFQPRSSNPKHRPIVVEHDTWEDNGVEVEIVGLVTDILYKLPR